MKKILSFLLLAGVLACLCGNLSACSKAPSVEEIYDRVVELIEASNEINAVYYGVGLPTYERDSDYANLNRIYEITALDGETEYVTPYSNFASIDEIKAKTEQVYSKDYRENVLYPAAFDGLAENGAVVSARYQESAAYGLSASSDPSNVLYSDLRVYDYATMKIVKPSSATSVFVSMDAWTAKNPTPTSVRLHLVYENNAWFLDSFAG